MKRQSFNAIVLGAIGFLTALLGLVSFLSRRKVEGADFSFLTNMAALGCICGVVFLMMVYGVISRFWHSLGAMKEGLSQATVEVSALSASFSDASIKISQSAMEEAAQMEQTASSINQVNEQANISLQKVEKIAKLSQETKQCAENGSQAISEMFGAIVAIDDSSKKVAQVIKTINDIAFQTNILALNAAVEAARAGESGRGFAVVAAEVRNLASRTSEAAISSTDMIQENLKNTKAGIEISTKVGEFLMGIMDHTDGMVEMLSQFDGAMKEQTTNVNQITATVNQCSQTIQQNAASIEENSNSAGALTDQVNIFKELLLELERVLSQRERYFASQEAVAPDAVLELPGGAALSEETAT